MTPMADKPKQSRGPISRLVARFSRGKQFGLRSRLWGCPRGYHQAGDLIVETHVTRCCGSSKAAGGCGDDLTGLRTCPWHRDVPRSAASRYCLVVRAGFAVTGQEAAPRPNLPPVWPESPSLIHPPWRARPSSLARVRRGILLGR
jgi:hypothetical protein